MARSGEGFSMAGIRKIGLFRSRRIFYAGSWLRKPGRALKNFRRPERLPAKALRFRKRPQDTFNSPSKSSSKSWQKKRKKLLTGADPYAILTFVDSAERLKTNKDAAVAQSVERRLGKAEVTGPIPVSKLAYEAPESSIYAGSGVFLWKNFWLHVVTLLKRRLPA